MNSRVSRRRFIRNTALSGSAFLILKSPKTAFTYEANERIQVALIGVGGRGTWFVDTIPRMEQVVAICDTHQKKIDDAYKRWADRAEKFAVSPRDWERNSADAFKRLNEQSVRAFRDFRQMFDRMSKEIDAVVVAVPDHSHAVTSLTAMKLGKHIYCEKPLTRTVGESRVMRETARRMKVASQMGNQGTAAGPFREALDVIRAGDLGEIREVFVWNSGGGANKAKPPEGTQPVPGELNWDVWLGPRPDRPFHPDWLRWHAWRDFATGQLGNWASHTANLAFMALEVDSLWNAGPGEGQRLRIDAKVSNTNRLSFPGWELIDWHVPAREGRLKWPAITIHWHNGNRPAEDLHLRELMSDYPAPGPKGMEKWSDFAGVVFVGTRGKLYATGHNATHLLMPSATFKDYKAPPPTVLPRSRGHEQEWFDACRGGKPAVSNFDYAGPLNEFLQLGNVAPLHEGPLEYDPVKGEVTNSKEANQSLTDQVREGWTV